MGSQYPNHSNSSSSAVFDDELCSTRISTLDNFIGIGSQSDLVGSGSLDAQQYITNNSGGSPNNPNSFSFNTYSNTYPYALEDRKSIAGLSLASAPLCDRQNLAFGNIKQNQVQNPNPQLTYYNENYGGPESNWQQRGPIPAAAEMHNDFLYTFSDQAEPRPEAVAMGRELIFPAEHQRLLQNQLQKRLQNELQIVEGFPKASPIVLQVNEEAVSPSLKMGSPSENDDISKKTCGKTRSAHNIIEHRYRTRMNNKFAALQNCVPTLRVAARRGSKTRNDYDSDFDKDTHLGASDCDGICHEDLEGLEPAAKLNKATILTKSVEYIKFLEKKNKRMRSEHRQLIERAQMLGISLADDLLVCDDLKDRGNRTE